MSATVRSHMKDFGRISVCGSISAYNDTKPRLVQTCEPDFVFRQIKMEGFLVHRWNDRLGEGTRQMLTWIQEVKFLRNFCAVTLSSTNFVSFQGKIKVRETYTEGFEKMPQAFIDMLTGGNTGKAIVKA